MGLAYGIKFDYRFGGEEALAKAKVEADERHRKFDGGEDEIAYRVEAVRYAGHDPYATPYGGEDYLTSYSLELFTFPILKHTPKGFTLKNQGMASANLRWVPYDKTKKQWASLTPEEALEQFRIRRGLQVRILKKQLARAEEQLLLSKKIEKKEPVL